MSDSAVFNLDYPRVFAGSLPHAQLKVSPEDFYVEEQLGFEPSGAGEHLCLFIEKRNLNTQHVAELMATSANISPVDVSYCGMKDRRALTRQWFSLYLPKHETPVVGDLNWLATPDLRILRSERHNKKLRRGDHSANLFRIRLHNLQGDSSQLADRLKIIAEKGVPNYYGDQRFGHRGGNLHQIEGFLAEARGKQRGFHDRLRVSVMRAWLFNQVLLERVNQKTWNSPVEGDPLDIASGPLWGRGRLASAGPLRELEQAVMNRYPNWCHFLEHCGLQQERRALVLKPTQLSHTLNNNSLELVFSLPAGGYATVLLRELAFLLSE